MKEILACLGQYSGVYLKERRTMQKYFQGSNLRTENGDWYCPSYAGFSRLQGSEIHNSRHIIRYSTVSGINFRQREFYVNSKHHI